MKRIAVFFGGNSNEREISVITGVYAVNLLRGAGYEVLPVFLTEQNELTLHSSLKKIEDVIKAGETIVPVRGGFALERKPKKKIPVDCALNCCHGGLGEGGALAALCALYQIPFASPGLCESAIFLDKTLAKYVLRGMGIKVAPSVALEEEDSPEEIAEKIKEIGYPLIVKPAALGSSIGITVVRDENDLPAALETAFSLCERVLAEKYFPNKRDLNCAAYRAYGRGGEIVLSPVEEVFSSEPLLSFKEKYESTERKSKIPAEIPKETEEKIKETLRRLYAAFGMRGIVRADFLLCGKEGGKEGDEDGKENDEDGKENDEDRKENDEDRKENDESGEEIYFNELNTVPGSLATYLYGEGLLSAKNLLTELVEDAIEASARPEKKLVTSGILSRTPSGIKSARK